ncbi:MAG: Response regulator receiver protein [Bacteroidota bacterium]|nr:Response regulator receiver protein [Bacteroidota bacterium]
MYDEEERIIRAIEEGANGFLSKSAEPEEILLAIQSVHLNGSYMPQPISLKLPKQNLSGTTIFSTQELEILHYLKEGLTSKKIGLKMFLSTRTIEDHRQQMMQKANVHNATALLRFAFEKL